jgi:hypothetical protein
MRAFTASPGRSDLLLPCVLLLGLHAAPGVAQVISYEEAAREAAADAEAILTVTVRALLSGGEAVPGDNLMGQRVRQLAADREGAAVFVFIPRLSPSNPPYPELDAEAVAELTAAVAATLRSEGLNVHGATEERVPARPRPTGIIRFADGSLAAECPIGPWDLRRRCAFHPDVDLLLNVGHPIPYRGGVRVPASIYREHGVHQLPQGSFSVVLTLRGGEWIIDQVITPF